jgi:polynucleotide 5'-hydroxyl-kinase GRC3/NOL9
MTDLISHIPSEQPLILNSPGWVKGNGLELLISVIEITAPTFVVVLTVDGNDSLATSLRVVASDVGANLLLIESGNTVKPAFELTAAESRTLGIMSYFHSTGTDKWDFSTHLMGWKPWVVPFTGAHRAIWAVAIQSEELLLEDVSLAINGTIMAIVLVAHDFEGTIEVTEMEGLPVLRDGKFMDPTTTRCLGYAIVRGIDVKAGTLHLLTPWDPKSLRGERVILERGRVNLPVWGMWDRRSAVGPWLAEID